MSEVEAEEEFFVVDLVEEDLYFFEAEFEVVILAGFFVDSDDIVDYRVIVPESVFGVGFVG